MADTTPLYAQRDIEALSEHYMRHLYAMTAERLHAKGDIAAELAWRDAEIEKLRAQLATLKIEDDNGVCPNCGKHVPLSQLVPQSDPFASEINNDETPRVQCDDCRYRSGLEI